MSLRISATLLESFRRWCDADEEQSDTIEKDLIAYIKGEFTTSLPLEIGKAYHAILEKPQRHLSGFYERNGILFTPEAIEPVLERIDRNGLFEVKQTRNMGVTRTNDGVLLVTKIDHIAGARGDEFKTTLSSFDSEKYMASYQWRVMMLLFELQSITYHVACLKEDKDSPTPEMPLYTARSIESLAVFPYPRLEADVRDLLADFLHYVRVKKLESYLVPGWEKAKVTA